MQLTQRGDQVLARRLVLSRKGATLEDIGVTDAPADHAVFLLEQIAVFTAWLGRAEQLAQIKKVTLRALLFIEMKGWAAGAPFLFELLGGYFFVLVAVQGVVEG